MTSKSNDITKSDDEEGRIETTPRCRKKPVTHQCETDGRGKSSDGSAVVEAGDGLKWPAPAHGYGPYEEAYGRIWPVFQRHKTPW